MAINTWERKHNPKIAVRVIHRRVLDLTANENNQQTHQPQRMINMWSPVGYPTNQASRGLLNHQVLPSLANLSPHVQKTPNFFTL